MDLDQPRKRGLFAQCSFVIVRSAELSDDDAKEVAEILRLHEGEVMIDDYNENSPSLEGVTHIIATTSDFPDYHAACDALIPVVKPVWVQHSLAKDKLAHTRQYSPDPRLFLSDVVACCADLPEGDADAIAGGILAMGGLYSSKLTSQVTHIVALDMEADHCVTAVKRNLRVKIVLPHWFDDCLKLGRKIDEQPYLLPDPDILRPATRTAPPSSGHKGQVTGAIHPDPSAMSPPPTPSATRKGQRVFKKKHVMLAKDLGVGSHLRGILEGIILAGGGKITDTVSKADMFICKFRSGPEYKAASRSGKDVGNLAWLYFLIMTDTWTSPLRRLLHYPVAKDGIPGFKKLKISLSNYSGEARTYLENLIIAAGAECTKTLKQDNTHLITAHVLSEKCAAAKDWGIHLINHLWLEESYARWKLQSVSDTRYTHFPKRTNLGEIVGHTPLDRDVLERHFFPDDGHDVEMTKASDEPEAMRPTDPNVMAGGEHDDSSTSLSVHQTKAKPFKGFRPGPGLEKNRTPTGPRFVGIGKENVTPSTTRSRKSKELAAARLQSLTPDIALYERERKRVGGVVYGGRRQNDEDRIVPRRKRSVDEATDSDATDENVAKKIKPGGPLSPHPPPLPPPVMHLLISGYKKWVGHPKLEDNDKKQLRNLGIIVTLDPVRASHLAAPHIVRTHKFVTALAYAPVIISTDFIDACLERDELLNPDHFELDDKANEKKLGVPLNLSRERAKENCHRLLQGRSIYCVENIHGGFDIFKSIVEANGGRCMCWRARKGTMVPSRRADSDATTDDESQNDVYLLTGPEKENVRLWDRFRQMAEASRKQPRIVSPDWLLETALCQKILPTTNYEVNVV